MPYNLIRYLFVIMMEKTDVGSNQSFGRPRRKSKKIRTICRFGSKTKRYLNFQTAQNDKVEDPHISEFANTKCEDLRFFWSLRSKFDWFMSSLFVKQLFLRGSAVAGKEKK